MTYLNNLPCSTLTLHASTPFTRLKHVETVRVDPFRTRLPSYAHVVTPSALPTGSL